ncbi:MAG: ABC transporter ATP-binding protein [Lachnospiraceae bacterium]|nr:ABC transporter ATP-binding protein [Lachnospiraceae bacterium]
MRFILRYVKPIKYRLLFVLFLKAVASFLELLIPYVLEHIIDDVVLENSVFKVLLWGGIMIFLAFLVWRTNVFANRRAVKNATDTILKIRQDLFDKTMNLSGEVFDEFGLPSLTSRMTSDSYNVQNFVRMVQTMGIRAPMLLIGGITVTLIMDAGLAAILCILAPIMIVLVVFISFKGIPLYENVQKKVDNIVRVMRENITGVRVVKALSKEEYEKRRFSGTNDEMTGADMKASIVMSMPGPLMQLFLNSGLTLVVFIGARRVNAGVTEPGVILAFLTYFNMVLMGVMGVNRLFMMMSKADASAKRIASAVDAVNTLDIEEEKERTKDDAFIRFDHVTFGYAKVLNDDEIIEGGQRRKAISDMDFSIKKGGSLGIIGATGSGKTTVFNLLMRFYDVDKGKITIEGRDVKTIEKDELHSMFGAVFQNDVLLTGTIRDNIVFGREVSEEALIKAAKCAGAYEFISAYDDGFDHEITKLGTNLSGGQKQRVLIARALAADPKILILDDASSALDYRTDADMRKAIATNYPSVTRLIVAQRISSILNCDEILVMDDGEIIARGTHDELLENSPEYAEIYRTQMGE